MICGGGVHCVCVRACVCFLFPRGGSRGRGSGGEDVVLGLIFSYM